MGVQTYQFILYEFMFVTQDYNVILCNLRKIGRVTIVNNDFGELDSRQCLQLYLM